MNSPSFTGNHLISSCASTERIIERRSPRRCLKTKNIKEDCCASKEPLPRSARLGLCVVLPAGYTFNADGTSIYLTMATLFVAQATGIHLSLWDQLVILGVALFTSKGIAGVAGGGFVALAATLSSMNKIPVAALVLLLGIDRFLNEARAVANLIGNGIATIAVAKWEGQFDQSRAEAVLSGRVEPEESFEDRRGTPEAKVGIMAQSSD